MNEHNESSSRRTFLKTAAAGVTASSVEAESRTAAAAAHLMRDTGATVVGSSFVVELGFLEGRKKLEGRVEALLRY